MLQDEYRVALVTLNPKPGKIQDNKAAIIEWLEQAGARTSKLAIFPELMLTGSTLTNATDIAIKRNDDAIEDIAQCAEIYDCIACFGFLEREGDHVYISQMFVGEGVRYVVRKSQLSEMEHKNIKAGSVPLVKEIDDIAMWCEIGHLNKANKQTQAKIPRGSTLTILPNRICQHQSEKWKSQDKQAIMKQQQATIKDACKQISLANQTYTLYVEQVGNCENNTQAPGYALIMDSLGNVMVERTSSREGMISTTLKLGD